MRKLFTHTDTTVREVKLGNGSTTVFNLAMEFFEDADLVINLVVIATGVKTLQVITTDYTLTGGNGASGTVTMIVAPPATDNLVIERKQPGTQAIDYEPNSPIPAETIEEGLDRSAMLANQAKEVGDRSIVFPIDEVLAAGDGELPVLAVRKNTRLAFDDAGKPIAVTDDITGVAASAFGASLVDDLNAAAARTTLGVVIGTDVLPEIALVTQAAAELGTATAEKIWSALRVKQAIDKLASTALPRSYLTGLDLSNNGVDAVNDIDIAVGECRDDADGNNLVPAAGTRAIDAVFSEGGPGFRDSTDNLTGAKTFHIYTIGGSGKTDDFFASTSLTPTLPTGFTFKRRIMSIRWSGSLIILFKQLGNEVLLDVAVGDYNIADPGISAVLRTLSVPTGIKVWAEHSFNMRDSSTGATHTMLVTSPDVADTVPSANVSNMVKSLGTATVDGSGGNQITVRTNTSGQVRTRLDVSNAGINIRGTTFGWIDRRGRDD